MDVLTPVKLRKRDLVAVRDGAEVLPLGTGAWARTHGTAWRLCRVLSTGPVYVVVMVGGNRYKVAPEDVTKLDPATIGKVDGAL